MSHIQKHTLFCLALVKAAQLFVLSKLKSTVAFSIFFPHSSLMAKCFHGLALLTNSEYVSPVPSCHWPYLKSVMAAAKIKAESEPG